MKRWLLPCVLPSCLLLFACRPASPPTDAPKPEPQAVQTAQATELRDAIQAPMDKARAVEEQTQKAADDQRAAIDAATAQ